MNVIDRVIILVREIGEEAQISPLILDQISSHTSFDKDLGLDSLAKVELIDRIENAFGVALSAETFSIINTPLELAKQIEISARESKISLGVPEKIEIIKPHEADVPRQAETLIDVLDWYFNQDPDRCNVHFYQDDGRGPIMSYRILHEKSRSFAQGLIAKGVKKGDRVGIMLPTGAEYFYSFMGTLMSGAIPVPVYPPALRSQLKEHLQRHEKILNNAGVVMLVTTREVKLMGQYLGSKVKTMKWPSTPEEVFGAGTGFVPIEIRPDDIALIQYTSGSTGDPKGVVLTHRQLLFNIRAMGGAVKMTSNDVVVSWLPLYHDMGLIGTWMTSLYYGAELVLMSPIEFITRPLRWLWAIHRYHGTLSTAPNFAYDLCLKRANASDLEGLSLSSWRAALNGAEPVSPNSLEKFYEVFSKYGLKDGTLMPVYGLAENGVALTFPPLGRGPLIKIIDRDLLMKRGIVKEVKEGMKVVSSGSPLPLNEVRIVNETGRPVPEGVVGEIEFRGVSSTKGYFNSPEKTKELFHNEWLVTGDLGFLSGGEIFITGRKKDIIIKAGRNIAPQELEEKVGELEGVRKGNVVVFAVTDPERGTEKLVIAAEIKSDDEKVKENLLRKINAFTVDLLDTAADEVLFLPPHSVLKTSSGKIRRSACKEAYMQGIIGRLHKKELFWWQARILLTALTIGLSEKIKKTFSSCLRFIYDAYFFLLAGLFFVPISLWIKLAPTTKKWRGIKYVVRSFLALTGTKTEIVGEGKLLAKDESCVFVANHSSFIDGAILATVLDRPLAFVAKKELKKNPFFNFILSPLNTIYVDRDLSVASLEQLDSALLLPKKHISLFFFPEGRFSRSKELQRFHMGAFITAVAGKLPVVPITILGTSRILGWEAFFPRPRNKIRLFVGDPILPVKEKENEVRWKEALILRDRARSEIMNSWYQ